MSAAQNGSASAKKNGRASDKMTSTTNSITMTTEQQLLSNYKISADKLSEIMKGSITFTKPVEVLHRYECDFKTFSKIIRLNDAEIDAPRIMATWVTMIMEASSGDRSDVVIDYEPDGCDQEEEDDDEPTMIEDIKESARQSYGDYKETLPEAVARRALREKDIAELKKAKQVATLKKMLSELDEKV
jgi:hypothetical protein